MNTDHYSLKQTIFYLCILLWFSTLCAWLRFAWSGWNVAVILVPIGQLLEILLLQIQQLINALVNLLGGAKDAHFIGLSGRSGKLGRRKLNQLILQIVKKRGYEDNYDFMDNSTLVTLDLGIYTQYGHSNYLQAYHISRRIPLLFSLFGQIKVS